VAETRPTVYDHCQQSLTVWLLKHDLKCTAEKYDRSTFGTDSRLVRYKLKVLASYRKFSINTHCTCREL